MNAAPICCAMLVCLFSFLASAPALRDASRGPGIAGALDNEDARPVFSPGQSGAAATADQAAEAAARDLVARYNSARIQQDAAALAALFTENADQLVSSGEWRRGRPALVRGMLQSSRTSPGDRTITVETVRVLGPDAALADARYEIAGAGGAEPRRMWSAFVIVRTPEGWRIAAIRNMLPAR